jgi:hypothetical protein
VANAVAANKSCLARHLLAGRAENVGHMAIISYC